VCRSNHYYAGQNELARDWLVLAFSRQRRVCRKEFVARTHLSIDMTTQLLEEFAVRGWALVACFDVLISRTDL
jgi:hypothetical protein